MTELPISALRLDGGTQPRAAIDFDAVADYQDAMEAGTKFPPITVFYDGSEYWVADGFHRVEAALGMGSDKITCDVHQGTVADAQWFSFSANKTNGLRRTNEDKQRAVKAALVHPRAAGKSLRDIAKHVGCSHTWVAETKKALVSVKRFTDSPVKEVTRNGTTYQQNVSNIGKAKREPAAVPSSAPVAEPRQPQSPLAAIPAVQPARSESEPETDPLTAEWMKRIAAAMLEITECEVTTSDLAAYIASHAKAQEVIRLLETEHEFVAQIIVKAKRQVAA